MDLLLRGSPVIIKILEDFGDILEALRTLINSTGMRFIGVGEEGELYRQHCHGQFLPIRWM